MNLVFLSNLPTPDYGYAGRLLNVLENHFSVNEGIDRDELTNLLDDGPQAVLEPEEASLVSEIEGTS